MPHWGVSNQHHKIYEFSWRNIKKYQYVLVAKKKKKKSILLRAMTYQHNQRKGPNPTWTAKAMTASTSVPTVWTGTSLLMVKTMSSYSSGTSGLSKQWRQRSDTVKSLNFEHQMVWQNDICKQCRPTSDCLTICHSTKYFICLFDFGLMSLSTAFSHIAMVSACGRELNARF